jgi:hypothetical protein
MTFSVAQFRERADANKTGYFVPDTSRGGYRVAPDREWADGGPRWQKWASNAARRAFVRSIKRDYPDIAEAFEREIEPLLQAIGKPLKAWHVKWVLHEVDHLLRFSQASTQAGLDQQLAEEQAMLNHFPIGNPPAPTAPRVDQPGEELLRPESVKNEGSIGEVDLEKHEFAAAGKSDKGKEREDAVPVADPPPQELWVSKVQRQGGRMDPARFARNRAERQRSAKGKQAEEGLPRVEAPARRQYHSAKELQRAKDALYKSFKAIERHAKNGTTRLALDDQDKALAELLSKANRPDCKSLDERIFELTGERTSLAIHWDLPKKMRSWVELILNATSRGDAAQIELEMRLHLEQLDKDVALLEKALAGKPVLRRTALNEALRQLKSMREQLESSEPWTRLGAHLQAMRDVLPPEPLPIKDPYIAEKRLEKLGISRKAGEDPVHLANEMVRAHNLLRDARLRDPNSSWTRVHEANPQHWRILDKYRSRRLDHIEEAVNRRSAGKAQIKFDRTNQTYTIATKDVGYGLQAFGQLRAIAWQIGGAPNLLTALGYDESDPSTG